MIQINIVYVCKASYAVWFSVCVSVSHPKMISAKTGLILPCFLLFWNNSPNWKYHVWIRGYLPTVPVLASFVWFLFWIHVFSHCPFPQLPLKAQAPSNKIIGKPKYLLIVSSLDSFKPFRTWNLWRGKNRQGKLGSLPCKDLWLVLLFAIVAALSGKCNECTSVILWLAVRVCLFIRDEKSVCVHVFAWSK